MSECTHDCSSCGESCGSRKESFGEKLNKDSSVKKVIGIISGKGGVGKSMVTSMLAVQSANRHLRTAILDADITGPSIPKMFGIKGRAESMNDMLLPAKSSKGIDIMSINLLLENDTDPVIWRGPVIAGAVKQFWTDVLWDGIDVMFIDMPPGTGDVPLTVFQSLPVDGIIIVTSPQELVSMIVEKAYNMARMMNIPVLGLVENMSYYECPKCKEQINVFGDSHIDEIAELKGLKVLAKLPINPDFASAADDGEIEKLDVSVMNKAIDEIEAIKK
ncbi:MAG: P-loop NTPase [Christensenellales bacterium]